MTTGTNIKKLTLNKVADIVTASIGIIMILSIIAYYMGKTLYYAGF